MYILASEEEMMGGGPEQMTTLDRPGFHMSVQAPTLVIYWEIFLPIPYSFNFFSILRCVSDVSI